MYEVFKIMQSAAEQIGGIKSISVHDEDKIWGNCFVISGVTADGCAFELNYTQKKKEATDADHD